MTFNGIVMYQLQDYARPMVGRSVQVNSLCFTKRDWKANVASEAKAHLQEVRDL